MILHQLQIASPYIDKHLEQLREENQEVCEDWIMKEHKRSFTMWLRNQNIPMDDKIMRHLADGPLMTVKTWQAYEINGYTFYTMAKDRKSSNQNSSVAVVANDSNGNKNTYYGYIDEIWELNYGGSVQIPVFKCQWVKHPQGVEVDEMGFTLVDLNKLGHKDDQWILPERVSQVVYVLEPVHEKKHIVFCGKQRILGVENVMDEEEYNQFDEMPSFIDITKLRAYEASISYSPLKPYVRTDCQGKEVQGTSK